MKISDVPNNTYVMNDKSSYTLPIEELRVMWNNFLDDEKEGWYTTQVERLKVDASGVIADVIESLSYDGYEEMDEFLWDCVTEEHIKKLQLLFNEMFDNSVSDVYRRDELITD